jgi:hypothetical protein
MSREICLTGSNGKGYIEGSHRALRHFLSYSGRSQALSLLPFGRPLYSKDCEVRHN